MVQKGNIDEKYIKELLKDFKPVFPDSDDWRLKEKIHERVGIRGVGFYDILVGIAQKTDGYLPMSIRSLAEKYYPSIGGVKNLIDIFIEIGAVDIVIKSKGSYPTIYKINSPNYLLGVPNIPSETVTPIQQEPDPIKPVEVKKPSSAPMRVIKEDKEMNELFASLPKKEETKTRTSEEAMDSDALDDLLDGMM